jgi:hypothetical protein
MERVDQANYAKREPIRFAYPPIRSAYEKGLRGVFPACKEPLPPKIEQLMNRLREVTSDRR